MSIATDQDNWERDRRHNSEVVCMNCVKAIRDGWQSKSSSGSILSGLLAAAAAQLLGFFKASAEGTGGLGARAPRYQNLVLVLCYAALVLNISATIGTFVLIDTLSDIAFKASKKEFLMARTNMNQEEILQYWGAGRQWNWMRLHWTITFYSGIFSLIASVLCFVWLAETKAVAITSSVAVGLTLIPLSYFIMVHPMIEIVTKKRAQRRRR
ncbi:hypothetical protein BJ912DRAFT_929437 [Pholiota molesta]|nr:hypothetical protein BJ912DRAFT_929437 [Pholiota molesta]